jgi:uncharacterized protein YndB with AHSA1/START domain
MTAAPSWTVELEHRVAAPPETVFEYFTDPEKYRRWKGVDAELDARPGGVYNVTMGPRVRVRGTYLAVEPPRRLLLSWGWESSVALPRGMDQVPPGSSTVEFTFVEDGDGTLIRVRHTGLPTEEARWAHELGWNGYLPRLGAVVEGEDPGEDPFWTLTPVLYGHQAGVSDASSA